MGAGLSSSAAFESIIGTIIDGLYNEYEDRYGNRSLKSV